MSNVLIFTMIIGVLAAATLLALLVKTRQALVVVQKQLAMRDQEIAAERSRADAIKQDSENTLKANEQKWQQQLSEYRQRFELAAQAMSDVLYILHIPTGTIEWNQNLYSIYGFATTEPTSTVEWWTAHIHPDDALEVNDMIDKLNVPGATNWAVEYRFRQADGKYTWVHDRAFILRDQNGEATELIGAIRPTVTNGHSREKMLQLTN